MVEDGYRLYDAPDGRLCFDQVVGGRIIPLRPHPDRLAPPTDRR